MYYHYAGMVRFVEDSGLQAHVAGTPAQAFNNYMKKGRLYKQNLLRFYYPLRTVSLMNKSTNCGFLPN